MGLSTKNYTGDGVVSVFTVPFPYLEKSHVKVRVNGIPLILNHTWLSDSSIRMNVIPTTGDTLTIYRETPIAEALIDFRNGALLPAAELDLAYLHIFYLQQEMKDLYDGALSEGLARLADGTSIPFTTSSEVLDALAQQVLTLNITDSLQQSISDITANANGVLQMSVLADSDFTALGAEEKSRLDADGAMAYSMSLLGAQSGDGTAWYLDETKVEVFNEEGTAREALGTRLTGLDVSIGDNNATIATETVARIAVDDALASTLTQVISDLGATDISVAGNASALTGLTTRVTTTEGDVTATSLAVTSLSTTVGTNTATITNHSTSIDGLEAKYGLSLDVNGYISGFELNNNGATSQFKIIADQFAIVSSGIASVVPFHVYGGKVVMEDAMIRDASIITAKIVDASITTAKIGTAAITAAKIGTAAITTAKIGTAAITAAKIGTAAITAAKIGELAVDTLHIKNYAVSRQWSASNGVINRSVTNNLLQNIIGVAADTTGDGTITITAGVGMEFYTFEYDDYYITAYLYANNGATLLKTAKVFSWNRQDIHDSNYGYLVSSLFLEHTMTGVDYGASSEIRLYLRMTQITSNSHGQPSAPSTFKTNWASITVREQKV